MVNLWSLGSRVLSPLTVFPYNPKLPNSDCSPLPELDDEPRLGMDGPFTMSI